MRMVFVSVALLALLISNLQAEPRNLVLEADRQLKARNESARSLSVRSEWVTLQKLVKSYSSIEEIFEERSGRIIARARVKYEDGEATFAQCYNGDFTIDLFADPNRDRLGNGKPPSRNKGTVYRAAIVNKGLHPLPLGPRATRNPWKFLSEQVESDLTQLASGKEKFDASQPIPGGIIQFTYNHFDFPNGECLVILDPAQGWNVISHQVLNRAIRALMVEKACEYKQDSAGVWVPVKGHWKTWNANSKTLPANEWTFAVTEIKVNPPPFDDKVFQVDLEPDTLVNDNRYSITYHTGPERVSSSQLEKLAEAAKAEKLTESKRHKTQAAGSSKPPSKPQP